MHNTKGIQIWGACISKSETEEKFLKMGSCIKLEINYFGPFDILNNIGLVGYILAFY